jgi:hypothetical protein
MTVNLNTKSNYRLLSPVPSGMPSNFPTAKPTASKVDVPSCPNMIEPQAGVPYAIPIIEMDPPLTSSSNETATPIASEPSVFTGMPEMTPLPAHVQTALSTVSEIPSSHI